MKKFQRHTYSVLAGNLITFVAINTFSNKRKSRGTVFANNGKTFSSLNSSSYFIESISKNCSKLFVQVEPNKKREREKNIH